MKNQLVEIVESSGLEKSKAQYILENFQDYFTIAADWEKKAQAIVVTKADQKAEMKMAREGRLFLKEKRVALEKARKELKEQSLREGKAIDGIANVLKALIVPIEQYLQNQENYVEIQAALVAEAKAREEAEKAEAARLKAEKAEAEEKARLQKENAKLKAEQAKKDAAMEKERAVAAAEKKKLEDAAAKAEADKQKFIDDQKRKEEEEAAVKARIAEQKAKDAKSKKYKDFLKEHGVNRETMAEFRIVNVEGKVTLFKKIAEITL